jgi:hypothetical protein
VLAAVEHRAREAEARGIPVARGALDVPAAGVGKPEQLGDLVERLSRRVVARLPEQAVFAPRGHVEQQGVAAAHQ